MVKKIVVIMAVVCAAVSCLDGSSYSQSGSMLASFEYNMKYSDVFGEDSLYFDTQSAIGIHWEGLLVFHQKVNKELSEFEGGLMLSYLSYPASGKTDDLLNNKYRANARKQTVPNTYLVFEQTDQMPENDMTFAFVSSESSTGTCVMNSCYVNNTVATAQAVEENFVPGDKLMLKAKGYLAGNETGTAEITLAEKSSIKDSIIYTWTPFDLTKLGTIDKVDFELLMPEGKEVPATVCIDNVLVSVSLIYQ